MTSDGHWVLYTDYQAGKPLRIMRVPLAGGRAEPTFAFPKETGETGAFCHCSPRGRCVLLVSGGHEFRGTPYTVFAMDAIHGRGAELARIPTTSGAILTPDGNAIAYIVPEDTGPKNHIRVVSFEGEPTREILVQNANRLSGLECSPTGDFLSVDEGSGRQTLVFITPNGHARALWTQPFGIAWATPSPDGKHLAITAETRQSNVWLADAH